MVCWRLQLNFLLRVFFFFWLHCTRRFLFFWRTCTMYIWHVGKRSTAAFCCRSAVAFIYEFSCPTKRRWAGAHLEWWWLAAIIPHEWMYYYAHILAVCVMRWFYFVSLYHSQNGNMTEWRIRGDNANLRHRMQKRDFIIVSSAWVQMSDPTHKHCCAPLFSSCGQNILPFYSRFEFKWFGPRRIIFCCCCCLQILHCYVNVSNVREESTFEEQNVHCYLVRTHC